MDVTTMEATRTGGAGNGVWTAARLNTVGWGMRLGIPWAVAGSALLISILVYAIVGVYGSSDGNTTGALAALYFSAAITYLQTITQTFGFALSLGVTRRNFYLGAGALVVGESLLHAIGMTVLLAVERATGGWGFDLQFFGVSFLVQGNPLSQVLVYLGPLLAMSFLAMLVGVVFKRWGQIGVWVTMIGSVLVLGGLAVLATWLMVWPAVGAFFTTTPMLLLAGVYPLVVAVVAALGGYLLVRRATP